MKIINSVDITNLFPIHPAVSKKGISFASLDVVRKAFEAFEVSGKNPLTPDDATPTPTWTLWHDDTPHH
jgi:hypothetical protein